MEANGLHVTVEIGAGYEPTERVRAALVELDQALQEAHGDEVQGFEMESVHLFVRGTYQKIEWTWLEGGFRLDRQIETIVSPRDPQSGLPTG